MPRGDINQDGRVDVVDMKIYFMPAWQELMSTGGNGREQLSYSAGGVPEEWQWYPGNDAYQQTHLDNRLGFAGYVWDPWLKVYHVRHRVYDPFDTRWLQADPIGYAGGDTDLRRYCNGDPVNRIDPMGLGPFDWLYTGDWNATPAMYDAATGAAGSLFFNASPIRGVAVNIEVIKGESNLPPDTDLSDLNSDKVTIKGGVTVGWTVDNGAFAAVSADISLDVPSSNPIDLSAGLGFGWSQDGGLGAEAGLSVTPNPNSGNDSGVAGAIGIDGTIILGIGKGPVNIGVIIDITRLDDLVQAWGEMLGITDPPASTSPSNAPGQPSGPTGDFPTPSEGAPGPTTCSSGAST